MRAWRTATGEDRPLMGSLRVSTEAARGRVRLG
jgi:hypothetical protein